MTQTTEPVTLLRVGRLMDGTGGPVQQKMAVRLLGSRIEAVGPDHELGVPEGASAEILDFPTATLLPGLIDCHTHTNMPGNGRRGEDVNENDNDELRLLRSAQNVTTALQTGVTTVGDCGGWNNTVFALKEGIRQGLVDGPRVVACGRPITITKGHCWFMGSEADGVDGVRNAARRLINDGADFLKVMATGGSTLGTDPYHPTYDMGELSAIVNEGHQENRIAAAHCRTNEAIRMVVDAGFDVIMHGWFTDSTGAKVFDDGLAEHIASHGVWVCPTLQITRSRIPILEARRERGELTLEEAGLLERMPRIHQANLEHTAKLAQAGVKFMAGSDCGWGVYPFGGFHLELQAMVDGGLTPSQAVTAATGNNAAALGLSDTVGTVSPGLEGDLLVVEGDPSRDVTSVANVLAVFKAGKRIR